MIRPYFPRYTSSFTASQLRWALEERSRAKTAEAFAAWDDEVRYVAGLLIAGGDYDGTEES